MGGPVYSEEPKNPAPVEEKPSVDTPTVVPADTFAGEKKD